MTNCMPCDALVVGYGRSGAANSASMRRQHHWHQRAGRVRRRNAGGRRYGVDEAIAKENVRATITTSSAGRMLVQRVLVSKLMM